MIGGISYFHAYAYDLLATNERIMAATCDAAIDVRRRGGPLQKVTYLSSSMVFESTDQWPSYEGQERQIPPPLSSYGFQKLAVEYYARAAWDQYQLPYTICRPFNCVGVGEARALGSPRITSGDVELAMSHVVPDLIQKVLKGQDPLRILGDGTQVRHYTYGGDLARGIAIAMEHEAARNEDFNLSTAESTTVLELAELIWTKIHQGDQAVPVGVGPALRARRRPACARGRQGPRGPRLRGHHVAERDARRGDRLGAARRSKTVGSDRRTTLRAPPRVGSRRGLRVPLRRPRSECCSSSGWISGSSSTSGTSSPTARRGTSTTCSGPTTSTGAPSRSCCTAGCSGPSDSTATCRTEPSSVLAHLVCAVLMRVLLRRLGVGPVAVHRRRAAVDLLRVRLAEHRVGVPGRAGTAALALAMSAAPARRSRRSTRSSRRARRCSPESGALDVLGDRTAPHRERRPVPVAAARLAGRRPARSPRSPSCRSSGARLYGDAPFLETPSTDNLAFVWRGLSGTVEAYAWTPLAAAVLTAAVVVGIVAPVATRRRPSERRAGFAIPAGLALGAAGLPAPRVVRAGGVRAGLRHQLPLPPRHRLPAAAAGRDRRPPSCSGGPARSARPIRLGERRWGSSRSCGRASRATSDEFSNA